MTSQSADRRAKAAGELDRMGAVPARPRQPPVAILDKSARRNPRKAASGKRAKRFRPRCGFRTITRASFGEDIRGRPGVNQAQCALLAGSQFSCAAARAKLDSGQSIVSAQAMKHYLD